MISSWIPVYLAVQAMLSPMAQTPPVKPNTEDIAIPPGLSLSPPEKKGVVDGPLSPEAAVQIALNNSPLIRIARANVRAASGRLQQARAGLYPSLSLSGGLNHTVDTAGSASTGSGPGQSEGYSTSLSLKQLLFDFNKTPSIVRQAAALERAARLALSEAESDLTFSVKTAWYSYQQANRVVGVNEENVKSRSLQLKLAQARLDSGLGAPADVVKATTSYDDALQSLTTSRANVLLARIFLATTLGVDGRTPIALADGGESDTTETDLGNLVNTALVQRPEMLAADLQVTAAKAAKEAAKAGNAPALNLSVSTGARGESNPFDSRTTSYGLSLVWSLWDSGATAGAVKQAEAAILQAEALLSQTALTVTSDVSQAAVQLQAATQKLKISETETKNAVENVRLAEGRYAAGLATFLEVTDAQSALVSARTGLVNAAADLDKARAALKHAIGPAGKDLGR